MESRPERFIVQSTECFGVDEFKWGDRTFKSIHPSEKGTACPQYMLGLEIIS